MVNCNTLTVYAAKINVGHTRQYFHLAYQKSNRDICYRKLDSGMHTHALTLNDEEFVSSNTGYSNHYKPSITATDFVSGETRIEYIRLAWRGFRKSYSENPPPPCAQTNGEARVLYKFKSPTGWSEAFVFGGGNVNSLNINKGTAVLDDNFEPFAIGWTDGVNCNYPNKYVRSVDLNIIGTLSTNRQ